MKLVIQRVNHANVKIDGEEVGKINKGLLVLVGVAADDDERIVEKYFNIFYSTTVFLAALYFLIIPIVDIGGLSDVQKLEIFAFCVFMFIFS